MYFTIDNVSIKIDVENKHAVFYDAESYSQAYSAERKGRVKYEELRKFEPLIKTGLRTYKYECEGFDFADEFICYKTLKNWTVEIPLKAQSAQ